jgi:hypothetical protein
MDQNADLIGTTECRVKLFLAGHMFRRVDEFYSNDLQLPEIHRWRDVDTRGVMFRLGSNTILELIDHTGSAVSVSGCGISLAVPDVWRLHEKLRGNSRLTPGPLRNRDWGDTSFQIEDPSGFEIVFFSKTPSDHRYREQ